MTTGEDEVSYRNIAIDRISELPESLIHHIFDLMRSTKAVARTQLLSKNWKRVFDSYQTFDFDQIWFRSSERFEKCVEKSLATRLDRLDCAGKFRLRVRGFSDTKRLAGWIRAAIAKDVKELDVVLNLGFPALYGEFPMDLTQSSSLTSLRIGGDLVHSLAAMRMCNLREISIKSVRPLDSNAVKKIEENCPLLENFRLSRCTLSHLHISSLNKLKTLEVQCCRWLEHIKIESPNLETFRLRSETIQRCRVDLRGSQNLKNLSLNLKFYFMDDSAFEDLISTLPSLERLELNHCPEVKKPSICSLTLRSLALIGCPYLERVKVDAPNLHSFRYKIRVMPFPFMHAPNLSEVKFSFDPYSRRSNAKYQNFFWNFDGSELQLKLVVYTKKSMKIFEDPRNADLSQLDDSKMEFTASSSKIFTIFEDWLRESHGKSLIVVSSNADLLKSINSLIIERDKSPSCCESDSDKCWRHYIKGVKVATSVAAEKTSYDLRWEPRKNEEDEFREEEV